jgi:hypothetical protein
MVAQMNVGAIPAGIGTPTKAEIKPTISYSDSHKSSSIELIPEVGLEAEKYWRK